MNTERKTKVVSSLFSLVSFVLTIAFCGVTTLIIFHFLDLNDFTIDFFGLSFQVSSMVAGLSSGLVYQYYSMYVARKLANKFNAKDFKQWS